MNTFIISYDLRIKKDYPSLTEAIQSRYWGVRVLESLWIARSTMDATEMASYLRLKMDSDDGIFVMQAWEDATWENTLCGDKWLKNNF